MAAKKIEHTPMGDGEILRLYATGLSIDHISGRAATMGGIGKRAAKNRVEELLLNHALKAKRRTKNDQ